MLDVFLAPLGTAMAFPIKGNGTEFGCSGGFGRWMHVDGIAEASQIARLVDGPVEVVRTRERDVSHDAYRSPCGFPEVLEEGRQ